MSFSSVELLKRLARSGLASPELGRKWVLQVANTFTSEESKDGHAILRRLVQLNLLTEFQASVIESPSVNPLVYGSWVLQAPLQDAVWKDWFVAIDRNDQHTVWLRPLAQSELSSSSIRQAAPSLERALQNSRVVAPGLQTVLAPEVIGGSMLLLVQPVQGKLLADMLTNNPLPGDQALSIIEKCVVALQQLHTAGIVHGRVLPDRIYLSTNGELTLARDSLCADTTRWNTDCQGVLNAKLPGGLCAAHFLAPEFLAAGHQPNLTSDVYALGCMWWILLTAKPPVNGVDGRSILAAQAQRLREQLPARALPEPYIRCLRHCLAKNPTARFRSATELMAALNAVPANSHAKPAHVSTSHPLANVADSVPLPSLIDKGTPNRQSSAVPPSPAKPASSSLFPVELSPVLSTPKPLSASAAPTASKKPTARRRNRRQSAKKWTLPLIAGGGGLALLLLLLFLTGALEPKPQPIVTTHSKSLAIPSDFSHSNQPPKAVARDERRDIYEIVHEGEGLLWAPPTTPNPLPLDLLPPGGQLFLSFRPARLFSGQTSKSLLAAFDTDLSTAWNILRQRTGLPPEAIDHCVAAHFPNGSGAALSVLRVKLVAPKPLSELRSLWGSLTELKGAKQSLLCAADGRAFYISNQPLIDSQSIAEFSVGPAELMHEVADASGAAGPLIPQIQRLWRATDRHADIGLFVYPSFLYSDGKQLLAAPPPRLSQWIKDVTSNNVRAVMLQTYFEPRWYYEVRAVGATDAEAGRISDIFKERINASPAVVENWFVVEQPHPHWRTLAMRFPRMLGTLGQHTRTAVENGQAILNGYLPSAAAQNLLVACWIASQDFATIAADGSAAAVPSTAMPSMTIEQYLDRPINLRFDQEAIEVALQLIADEANSGLPAGTSKLRFKLDGAAFEKGGITRNQQIRDFNLINQPMRNALTLLAQRGNPDPSVTDLREENQKLIWVLKKDNNQLGENLISLTTRDAANTAGISLPREFAKAP